MADISHKDLLESLGNTAAGFSKNLANSVANFACDLYKKYPGAPTFGDTGNYSRGFWDELCSSRPSPPPALPKPSLVGGQCVNVFYRVTYSSETANYPGIAPGTAFTTRHIDIFGPVRNFTYEYRSDSIGYQARVDGRDGTFNISSDGGGRGWLKLRSVNVQRLDGQADNCGNEPTNFPVTNIPSSERTTRVNVQLRNGDSYNIPITLVPTTNNYGVQFDAGDINVKFDLSGASFNPTSIAKTINNVENTVLSLSQNVNNFTAIAVPFINNSIAYSNSFNFGTFKTKEDSGSSSPADENAAANLAYITLDITKSPRNAKTQEGELAQDLVYAGWFQFAAKGYYFPREPIHFSKAIFKAPLGATDYAFTLYEGFEAKVVEHRI